MILASLGQNDAVACYRVILPAYGGTPLSGMGAARQGGRFNRPGDTRHELGRPQGVRDREFDVRPRPTATATEWTAEPAAKDTARV
jgi:hypothetical protein